MPEVIPLGLTTWDCPDMGEHVSDEMRPGDSLQFLAQVSAQNTDCFCVTALGLL